MSVKAVVNRRAAAPAASEIRLLFAGAVLASALAAQGPEGAFRIPHGPCASSRQIFVSASQQLVRSSGFEDVNAWGGNLGFNQAVTRIVSVNLSYAYLRSTNHFVGLPGALSSHAVRLALVIDPKGQSRLR